MSDFQGFFQAHFVADMSQIQDKLTTDLVKANRTDALAAVIFANARKNFSQEHILPLVSYWNYRSRDFVTFFFVGYVGDEKADDSGFVTVSDPQHSFHEKTFVETIEEFEKASSWKYRGDTPLILCRGYLRYNKKTGDPKAFLDLSSVLEFELERALNENAIQSVDSFFEAVIRAAKETPGHDVHWRLSDQLGARALGEALKDAVGSKLPGVKRIIDAIRFFRVKPD